jgi:hypothetical protein
VAQVGGQLGPGAWQALTNSLARALTVDASNIPVATVAASVDGLNSFLISFIFVPFYHGGPPRDAHICGPWLVTPVKFRLHVL